MKIFAIAATAFLGAEGVRLMANPLKGENVPLLRDALKAKRNGVCGWAAGHDSLPAKWPTDAEKQKANTDANTEMKDFDLVACRAAVGSHCAEYEAVIDGADESHVKNRVRELCPKPTTPTPTPTPTTTTTTTTTAAPGGGSC